MFSDRIDAGKQLAEKLQDYKNQDDVVVLALPRSGRHPYLWRSLPSLARTRLKTDISYLAVF